MIRSLPSRWLPAAALVTTALAFGVAAGSGFDIRADPNASAELKGVQLRIAKRAAIQGDATATKRVVDHYVLVEGNRTFTDAWARVAAIQGDQAEMLNLASHISRVGTEGACIEALAWINKVRAAPASKGHRQKAARLHEELTNSEESTPCAKWYQRNVR